MSWVVLFLAGLLEVVWATGLKLSDGFTRPLPSIVTVIAMIASLALLSVAMRSLPMGTTYAVWTGIGAVGAFIAGIVMFAEPLSVGRVVSATLIIAGIAGLKIFSPH